MAEAGELQLIPPTGTWSVCQGAALSPPCPVHTQDVVLGEGEAIRPHPEMVDVWLVGCVLQELFGDAFLKSKGGPLATTRHASVGPRGLQFLDVGAEPPEVAQRVRGEGGQGVATAVTQARQACVCLLSPFVPNHTFNPSY